MRSPFMFYSLTKGVGGGGWVGGRDGWMDGEHVQLGLQILSHRAETH